jgi:hypothetical protein
MEVASAAEAQEKSNRGPNKGMVGVTQSHSEYRQSRPLYDLR